MRLQVEVLKPIEVHKEISDEELPLLMKCADIFIFPSLYEGFGFPPLEAMSLGVPTIVSNASSLPEVVGNGAVIVDPRNPQDLARAMLGLLNDEHLRKNLSKKGIERSQTFSWTRTAEEIIELYLQVCKIKERKIYEQIEKDTGI